MFASLKKQPFIKMAQLSTLIAEGVEITGNLLFTNGMRIDGRVKGDVTGRPASDAKSPSLLVLSANGHIEAACAAAMR
jgi:cytoskeletal protein CcmA (bactofilin family)